MTETQPVETQPVETQPTVPTPEKPVQPTQPAENDKLTHRFVELSRREKKVLEIERAAKEREAQLKALQEFETTKTNLKSNPLKALEYLGVDFNTLAQHIINEGKPETVEEKVARLEKERAEEKRLQEEAKTQTEKQQEEQIITAFKEQIETAITSNLDEYELINLSKAYDTVFELIEANYQQTQQVMPISEAAKMVEDYLYEESVSKYKASKKLAKIFTTNETQPVVKSSTTLTSKLSNIVEPEQTTKYETHDEAIARIAAKVKAKRNANNRA